MREKRRERVRSRILFIWWNRKGTLWPFLEIVLLFTGLGAKTFFNYSNYNLFQGHYLSSQHFLGASLVNVVAIFSTLYKHSEKSGRYSLLKPWGSLAYSTRVLLFIIFRRLLVASDLPYHAAIFSFLQFLILLFTWRYKHCRLGTITTNL